MTTLLCLAGLTAFLTAASITGRFLESHRREVIMYVLLTLVAVVKVYTFMRLLVRVTRNGDLHKVKI